MSVSAPAGPSVPPPKKKTKVAESGETIVAASGETTESGETIVAESSETTESGVAASGETTVAAGGGETVLAATEKTLRQKATEAND